MPGGKDREIEKLKRGIETLHIFMLFLTRDLEKKHMFVLEGEHGPVYSSKDMIGVATIF